MKPSLDLGTRQAVEPTLETQQLEPRLLRIEGGLLQRNLDSKPHLLRLGGDVVSGDDCPASGWREQGAQQPHHGRLARTVRSEESVDLTPRDLEIDSVDSGDAVEGTSEAMGANGHGSFRAATSWLDPARRFACNLYLRILPSRLRLSKCSDAA